MRVVLVLLFAMGQIGIFTHAIEHIEHDVAPHTEHDDHDQNTVDGLCIQCIAQYQSEHADLPNLLVLSLSDKQSEVISFALIGRVSYLYHSFIKAWCDYYLWSLVLAISGMNPLLSFGG